MLAALARCIASSALSSLRAFCSTLARIHFWRPKKRHHVLAYVLQELKFGKECGLLDVYCECVQVCFRQVVSNGTLYLPTSSTSLKTGSIAVLTMCDFSIKESSSAKCHILWSSRTCPIFFAFFPLTLSVFLYSDAKQGAWYLASSATKSPMLKALLCFAGKWHT